MVPSARVAAAPRSLTVERYLEAIYYIEHEGEVARPGRLAEWLGVSAPTATVSLQRLVRDGKVTSKPHIVYGPRQTPVYGGRRATATPKAAAVAMTASSSART